MSVAEILEYTYDDYVLWEGDWELIDGFPAAMAPAPVRIHQNVAVELVYAMKRSLETLECAEDCLVSIENDWKVSYTTVVRPDIVLTCGDEGERYLTKAPKIVVEIVSPSSAKKDELIKYELYEKERVGYYVLVYPEDRKAKIYRHDGERFVKVGDFTNETYRFEGIDCPIKVDFSEVFGKLR